MDFEIKPHPRLSRKQLREPSLRRNKTIVVKTITSQCSSCFVRSILLLYYFYYHLFSFLRHNVNTKYPNWNSKDKWQIQKGEMYVSWRGGELAVFRCNKTAPRCWPKVCGPSFYFWLPFLVHAARWIRWQNERRQCIRWVLVSPVCMDVYE